MSANQFTMTAQEMQAFAGHIEEVIGRIGQERTRLNTTVEQVGAGWGGQAAEAYKALQHRFNEDVDALNGSLKAIKDAIELTTKYYAQTEARQQQQFSGAQG